LSERESESGEEGELKAAIAKVLSSPSRKKLVIAGPGTGKTTLFRQMLELASGDPDRRIVLTFINTLRNDLESDLEGLARVFTLHSYCLGLLYADSQIRGELSSGFRCCPGLAGLIARDWKLIYNEAAPKFVEEMRKLSSDNHISFFLARGEYYNAVDFDDSVYRVYDKLISGSATPKSYDLVLIDEYQDFNRLEAGFIDILGEVSPITIAGDDDQALYSQLRAASWDHIRLLSQAGDYEVFQLPFCMRCPEVIVDAVNDVLTKAQGLDRLQGRIEKPYRHFPAAKGADSAKYPKIVVVETSVQRENANYMGRYIAQAILEISRCEIEEALQAGYPAVLVIVAKPYRDQIISFLEGEGFPVDTRRDVVDKLDRDIALGILKEDPESNLGWRIILDLEAPEFLADAIRATADMTKSLKETLPKDFRERVLKEASAYEVPDMEEEVKEGPDVLGELPAVKVTSFEGAKGLSAQHVFLAGLHDGELPRNPKQIQDIEICKFLVGLTRTRKQCQLIYTRQFAGKWKSRSSFISWIVGSRLNCIQVNASYWKTR
jgi:superfamily I DNA/RNA helicase